jgi:hypothetical protein
MAICKRVIEGHLWVDSGRSRPVSLAMPCARKGLLVVPDLKILRGVDRSIATGRAVNHWDCGLGRDQCAPVWLGEPSSPLVGNQPDPDVEREI